MDDSETDVDDSVFTVADDDEDDNHSGTIARDENTTEVSVTDEDGMELNGRTEPKTNLNEMSVAETGVKVVDILLEDDKLTLWKASQTETQYNIIPIKLPVGDLSAVLKMYYTKFDCVTSILTFDDAVPIIQNQTTTLRPTDDYTLLRDYPLIQGIWFKPDIEHTLGPDEDTTLGNIKLCIPLSKDEKQSLFKEMNIYFIEVLDYPAEEKSVSRLLITKARNEKFEKYDILKPGGPVFVVPSARPGDGDIDVYYLRLGRNHMGVKWRHEVEFMLEEDPWPLCKIIPVNNHCFKRQSITVVRDVSLSLPSRYIGATWRESLAGLFVWALRTHLVWLVFERLHTTARTALNIAVRHIDVTDVIHTECPQVCPEMFETYETLATFMAKCENEHDIKDIFNIFLSLHSCTEDCSLVSLKTLESTKVLQGILFLLEKLIACASPNLRHEVTSTILPWAVMGYYCSDLKIRSHRKMVIFISRTEGINTDIDLRSPFTPDCLLTSRTMESGYGSPCYSPMVTPRISLTSPIRKHYSVRSSRSSFSCSSSDDS